MWRAPVHTEQGNPGIYIQADEWQETYGGNVFVVDEVTGRIYVLRGDTSERIPEVASSRRRDEHLMFLGRVQGCEPLQSGTPKCQ